MDRNNRTQQDGTRQSAEDRALDRFAELMIERLQDLQHDWKKPWFTDAASKVPRNLSGRNYNGMNSLMLMLHCQKNNYELPVFATFDRISALNFTKEKDGTRHRAVDANGHELPLVSIDKGEKSFPVMITTFTCIEKDTKEKIPYDDYKKLDQDSRSNYNVYPKQQVYNVFAVAQTNLKEARPELYAKLEAQCNGKLMTAEQKGKILPAVEAMIKDNGWYCPIKEVRGDSAYYSISRDEIVLPERSQFKDLEAFQSNLFHEAAHSSGSENRLGRLKEGASFGSAEYAKEELTAELTAAFVAANYGMTKGLKEDSAPYLKSWLDSLQEKPDFLKTVLMDVKRASSMLTQRIDAINERIEQGLSPVAAEWKQEHEQTRTIAGKPEEMAAKGEPLADDEVRNKLDSFMQMHYIRARRENDFRLTGFEQHDGKPALRMNSDAAIGTSYYIITHEQDAEQKDHFYMSLIDKGEEIFKSREMPHNMEEASSFLHGAAREQREYSYEQLRRAMPEGPQESQETKETETMEASASMSAERPRLHR